MTIEGNVAGDCRASAAGTVSGAAASTLSAPRINAMITDKRAIGTADAFFMILTSLSLANFVHKIRCFRSHIGFRLGQIKPCSEGEAQAKSTQAKSMAGGLGLGGELACVE